MVQRWRGHHAKRSQHFVLFALGLGRESRPGHLGWSLGDDNSWSDLEGWRSLAAVVRLPTILHVCRQRHAIA